MPKETTFYCFFNITTGNNYIGLCFSNNDLATNKVLCKQKKLRLDPDQQKLLFDTANFYNIA